MFCFKADERIFNAVYCRLKNLFDNLCTIEDFGIDVNKLKVFRHLSRYDLENEQYRVVVEFESNLHPVVIWITKEDNRYMLEYNDKQDFQFTVVAFKDKTQIIPAFSRYSNFNPEIVDLAIYELEQYIKETHIDKFFLMTYNSKEIGKLETLSIKRI